MCTPPPVGKENGVAGLARSTKAGFAVGQIAGQLFRDVPSLLLLFYLTTVMGVPPAIAGSAIFLPKVIFGALFDLAVGMGSDRLASRFPRRRWLLIGGMLAPFAMISVFAVPEASRSVQVGWVFITFSFYMATFSTFSVPYLAQFAEMSTDQQERTELMAWKHGLTGMGVLLSSAVAPALVGQLGGGRPAYLVTAALVGVLCLVCLVTAWKFAGRIADPPNRGTPLSLRDLPGAFRDRDFAVLCLSAVIMTVASGISYASFAFFVKFAMHRADAFAQIGVMSTIMAVAVMAGSPLWVGVAARIGKKATYVVGACGHGLVTIAWGWMADGPIIIAYVLAGLMAVFNAGWGLIVLSLLSDTIANARERWGENRAGVYSAIWSIIEKAGIALGGTLIVGALLSGSGFDAAAAQSGASQSAAAIRGIVLSYALVPGVAKLVAAAIIWRFVASGKD